MDEGTAPGVEADQQPAHNLDDDGVLGELMDPGSVDATTSSSNTLT